jgi:membrane associated rhomboid family serine protease
MGEKTIMGPWGLARRPARTIRQSRRAMAGGGRLDHGILPQYIRCMGLRSVIRRPFRYSFGNATIVLIAANVVVFMLSYYFFPKANAYLGLSALGVAGYGYAWQLASYMFCHQTWAHLLFNMLGLFIFGLDVERRVGTKEFLLFYFVVGILSGAVSLAIYLMLGVNTLLIGASGVLFGIMLAFAVFFPDAKVYVFGILPMRAPVMVIGYTLIEVVSQLFSFQSGVAHLTHLAGFGVAYLYFLARYGINPWKRFFLK